MEDGNKIYEYSKITQLGTARLILLDPSDDLEAGLSCSLINASLQECDDECCRALHSYIVCLGQG